MDVRLLCDGGERWERVEAGDIVGRKSFERYGEAIAARISRNAVKIVALTAVSVTIQRTGSSHVHVELPAHRALAQDESVDLPRFAGVVLSLAKGTARLYLDVEAPAVVVPRADAVAEGSPAKRAKLDASAAPGATATFTPSHAAPATLMDDIIDVVDEDGDGGGDGDAGGGGGGDGVDGDLAAAVHDSEDRRVEADDEAMASATAVTSPRPIAGTARRASAGSTGSTPQRGVRLAASTGSTPAARSGSRERAGGGGAAVDGGGDRHVSGVKRKHHDVPGDAHGETSGASPSLRPPATTGSAVRSHSSPRTHRAAGVGISPSLPVRALEGVVAAAAEASGTGSNGPGARHPGSAAAAPAARGRSPHGQPVAAAPAAASGPLSELAFALVDVTDAERRLWTRRISDFGGIVVANAWVRPSDADAAKAMAELALKKKACAAFQAAQGMKQFAAMCEHLTAGLGLRRLVAICKKEHCFESLAKWFGSALLPFDACHFAGYELPDDAVEALGAVNAHDAMRGQPPIEPVFAQYRTDGWLQETLRRFGAATSSSSASMLNVALASDTTGTWHAGDVEKARISVLRSLSVIERPSPTALADGALTGKSTAAAPAAATRDASAPAAAAGVARPDTHLVPPRTAAAAIPASRVAASTSPHGHLSVTARGVDLEGDDHPFADVYDRILYYTDGKGQKDTTRAFEEILQPLITKAQSDVATAGAPLGRTMRPVDASAGYDVADAAAAAPSRGTRRSPASYGGASASSFASLARRPFPYAHVYDTSTLPLAPSGLPLPLRPLGEYLCVEGVDEEGNSVLRPSEDDYRTVLEDWTDEPGRVEALRRGFGVRASDSTGGGATFGPIQPTGCPFTLDQLTCAEKPVASVGVLKKGLPARKIMVRHPCLVLVVPGGSEAQRALGGDDSEAGSDSDKHGSESSSGSEGSADCSHADGDGHAAGRMTVTAVGGAGTSAPDGLAARSSTDSGCATASSGGRSVPPLVCPYGILRRRNVNPYLTQPLLSRLQLYEDNKGADAQSDFKAKQLKVALGIISCVERPLESLSDLKLLRPWLDFSSSDKDRRSGRLTGDKINSLLQAYRNRGRRMPPPDCTFNDRQLAKRELQSIHGIGATKVQDLLQMELLSVADVRRALADPRHPHHATVVGQFGSGALRKSLQYHEDMKQRISREECEACLAHVREVADAIAPGSIIHLVGSYRRGKPTSGDIDMLLAPPDDKTVKDFYVSLVEALADSGFLIDAFRDDFNSDPANRGKVTTDPTQMFLGFCRLPSGSPGSASSTSASSSSAVAGSVGPARRIDMKFTKRCFWPTALLTWTGNALFNRILREYTAGLGWDIGHSGIRAAGSSDVERLEDGRNCRTMEVKVVPVNTEADVFSYFGLQYIPPNQRNYCDAVLAPA